MAIAKKDFTFPVNSIPSCLKSPPLWRFSCSSTSNHEAGVIKAELDDEKKHNLCLFQESEASVTSRTIDYLHFDSDEKEEKMDMLWEELNEEALKCRGRVAQTFGDSRRKSQTGCVDDHKTWKLSKPNGRTISGKKANILVVIDVLKKALSMPNSPRSVTKRVW